MDDANRFRRRLPIPQDDVAVCRSGRVRQPFKLQAGEYVGQASISVVTDLTRVEQVIACRKDDIADLKIDQLILLLEIDRAGWAEFFTSLACSFNEVGAVLLIHYGILWHGLIKRGIYGFAISQTCFKLFIDHFL